MRKRVLGPFSVTTMVALVMTAAPSGVAAQQAPPPAALVNQEEQAVQEADGLVAELMQTLAGTFADERARLEGEWERGAQVSTEDLRQALQHYRSFFQRLLSA